MSLDFFCSRCKKIHSYRMSFCPSDASKPTLEEIEDNLRYEAWRDNKEIDRLEERIKEIKGNSIITS